VTVREPDQSWIYDGFYTCVANNTYGMDDIDIKLERASKTAALFKVIKLGSLLHTRR